MTKKDYVIRHYKKLLEYNWAPTQARINEKLLIAYARLEDLERAKVDKEMEVVRLTNAIRRLKESIEEYKRNPW